MQSLNPLAKQSAAKQDLLCKVAELPTLAHTTEIRTWTGLGDMGDSDGNIILV